MHNYILDNDMHQLIMHDAIMCDYIERIIFNTKRAINAHHVRVNLSTESYLICFDLFHIRPFRAEFT